MIIDRRKEIQENNPFTCGNFTAACQDNSDGSWKTLTFEDNEKHANNNFKYWFYCVEKNERNNHVGVLYARGKYSEFYIEGCFS